MLAQFTEIKQFLLCSTPTSWVDMALRQQELMLIDHAHCEKKAASTALSLIYRYVDKPELLQKLSRLAREELRHFEQVHRLLSKRGFVYRHLSAARYAQGLQKHISTVEPSKLIDTLVVGAFIEARSCERFGMLAPHLDEELSKFYAGLLASENRHFQDYLTLAQRYAHHDISERIGYFAKLEAELITTPDPLFRFHSGVPKLLLVRDNG